MFQFQIDEMKQGINKVISRRKPPEEVLIKHGQAVYLGCQFWSHNIPTNEVSPRSGIIVGRVDCLVKVKLLDLYNAIQEATGVEYETLKTGNKPGDSGDSGVIEPDVNDATDSGPDQATEA